MELIEIKVNEDKEVAEGEKIIADGIAQECQNALNEAEPLFRRAIQALRTLQPKDFSVMKTYT